MIGELLGDEYEERELLGGESKAVNADDISNSSKVSFEGRIVTG